MSGYFERWERDLDNLRNQQAETQRFFTVIGVMGGCFLAAVVQLLLAFLYERPPDQTESDFIVEVIIYGIQSGAMFFCFMLVLAGLKMRSNRKKFEAVRALEDLGEGI